MALIPKMVLLNKRPAAQRVLYVSNMGGVLELKHGEVL